MGFFNFHQLGVVAADVRVPARRLTSLAVAAGMVVSIFGASLTLAASAQARGTPDGFADLAEKLLPAVVNISTTQNAKPATGGTGRQRGGEQGTQPEIPQFPPGSPFEDLFKDFFDRQQREGSRPSRPVMSLGSGFVVDPSGIMVTNNHVIADADEIKVILQDDTELTAKLIGRDAKVDVAVLKVEPKTPLVAVPWGDSSKIRVGDWVVAIGNPFGLGGTVTAGIVSARGRNIKSGPYDDFIQTDASINKGNSGGPLFNMDGQVIGINTAIFSNSGGSVGIGFSTPSELAQPVVQQLRDFGRTKRGWLGVRIQSVTDEIADSLGLDRPRGALIAGVNDNGPAQKAKIEVGDVILTFDGKPVPNMSQLPRLVAETPIGRDAPVEIWRKGKTIQTKVKVGELDETADDQVAALTPAPKQSGPAKGTEKNVDLLGLKIAPITADLRKKYDLKGDVNGVVVTEVNPNGPAAQKDIRPGDVIVEVAQSEVKTTDDVIGKVKGAQDSKRKAVLLLILRAGDLRFLTVPFKS